MIVRRELHDGSLMQFVASVCLVTFENHPYLTPAFTPAQTFETTHIRRADLAFILEKETTHNKILIPLVVFFKLT